MISLHNCTKAYKEDKVIFKNLSVHIDSGDLVAIIGESGAGKTTLLNIFGLLDKSYQGEYILNGISFRNMNQNQIAMNRNHLIGFIFQSYHLLPYLSVEENIRLPILYSKSRTFHWDVDSLLEKFHLKDIRNQNAITLSGGEKQRTAIARAIVNNPKLIIADEPTGNLDNTNSEIVMSILKELNRNGMTVIIATHDMEIASQCRKIFKIDKASLVCVNS